MNHKLRKKISKFLSYLLRHNPEEIGLELNQGGWAKVSELISRIKEYKNFDLDFETLCDVVENNNKKRFTFNDDKTMLKANQGHSISVDLELEPVIPPDILYHGTAEKFINSIKKAGLTKKNRHHVHLSPDEKTAFSVGSRHGKPVILKIKAKEMYVLDYDFFCSKNGVWLTDHIPTQFIIFPG